MAHHELLFDRIFGLLLFICFNYVMSSRACAMHEGSRGLGLDLGYHVPVGMCGSLGVSECV